MKRLITFLIIGAFMTACSGKQPTDLGITNGKLAPCPSKPNCVSSQETSDKHGIDAIKYTLTDTEAYDKIKKILNSLKKATIIEEKPNYLRAEFKSKIIGFVDDVEFYFPGNGKIDVRSASRLGYSDLGVNRKRIEQIRDLGFGNK